MKKHLKWLIPVLVVCLIAGIVTGVAVFMSLKNRGSVMPERVTGIVAVSRDGKETFLSDKTRVFPGDRIRTDATSTVVLPLGKNGSLFLSENSEATYTWEDKRPVLTLSFGSLVVNLDKPEDARVKTGDQLVSTGGEVYLLRVGEAGTSVSVFSGSAGFERTGKDPLKVEAGSFVRMKVGESGFTYDGEGKIALLDVPKDCLAYIGSLARTSGRTLYLTSSEIASALLEKNRTYTVTFKNPDGTVFVTTGVKSGEKVSKPRLSPELDGHWDFDFSTPIYNDTEIFWVRESET